MIILGHIGLNIILLKFSFQLFVLNMANTKFKIESWACIVLLLGSTSVKCCNQLIFLVIG